MSGWLTFMRVEMSVTFVNEDADHRNVVFLSFTVVNARSSAFSCASFDVCRPHAFVTADDRLMESVVVAMPQQRQPSRSRRNASIVSAPSP